MILSRFIRHLQWKMPRNIFPDPTNPRDEDDLGYGSQKVTQKKNYVSFNNVNGTLAKQIINRQIDIDLETVPKDILTRAVIRCNLKHLNCQNGNKDDLLQIILISQWAKLKQLQIEGTFDKRKNWRLINGISIYDYNSPIRKPMIDDFYSHYLKGKLVEPIPNYYDYYSNSEHSVAPLLIPSYHWYQLERTIYFRCDISLDKEKQAQPFKKWNMNSPPINFKSIYETCKQYDQLLPKDLEFFDKDFLMDPVMKSYVEKLRGYIKRYIEYRKSGRSTRDLERIDRNVEKMLEYKPDPRAYHPPLLRYHPPHTVWQALYGRSSINGKLVDFHYPEQVYRDVMLTKFRAEADGGRVRKKHWCYEYDLRDGPEYNEFWNKVHRIAPWRMDLFKPIEIADYGGTVTARDRKAMNRYYVSVKEMQEINKVVDANLMYDQEADSREYRESFFEELLDRYRPVISGTQLLMPYMNADGRICYLMDEAISYPGAKSSYEMLPIELLQQCFPDYMSKIDPIKKGIYDFSRIRMILRKKGEYIPYFQSYEQKFKK